jgi:hypothetical protein
VYNPDDTAVNIYDAIYLRIGLRRERREYLHTGDCVVVYDHRNPTPPPQAMNKAHELFDGLTARDVVMWTKPQATGTIVGGAALVLLIFGWFEYTWLTLLCRFAQLALVGYGLAARFGLGVPTAEELTRLVSQALDTLHPIAVRGAGFAAKILTWEDNALSLKALFASFVLAVMGNLFSDMALLFLATVAVFAGPTVYVNNQKVIDQQLATLKTQTDKVFNAVPASSGLKQE